MQYRVLAATAFAAVASAQTTSSIDYSSLASVLSVLETALPSSLIAEAVTNSAAVSSQIAAEFAEGSTPGWFQSLPSGVKTYLVPASTNATATATGNVTAVAAGSSNSTVLGTGSSYANSTSATSVTSGSLSSSASSSSGTMASHASASSVSTSASASSSSSSSAGASMPTAIFGAGIAGAMGLVGLLAL